MCDEECRKRLERVEFEISSISNDMKWIRWILRTGIVAGGLILGIDVTGMV